MRSNGDILDITLQLYSELKATSISINIRHSCPERPDVTLKWWLIDWGYQVIKWKARQWTIVGNLLKECRGHCTLNISFVEFEKEFADYFFSPYEAIHVLPMTVKGAALVGLFFLHFCLFFDIVELVLVLNIEDIFDKECYLANIRFICM